MTPITCSVVDWIATSNEKSSWLTCGGWNNFITGFYRLNPPDNVSDPISLLEQGRCCSAIPEFSGQDGTCEYTYWGTTLDTCVFDTHHSLYKRTRLVYGWHAWVSNLFYRVSKKRKPLEIYHITHKPKYTHEKKDRHIL